MLSAVSTLQQSPKKKESNSSSQPKKSNQAYKKPQGYTYCKPVHHRSEISKQLYKSGVREETAVNNRQNNRPFGKTLARKTATYLSTSKETLCKFNLTVRCSHPFPDGMVRFYVVGGLGNKNHSHHLKAIDNTLITRRKNIIPQKALAHMKTLTDFSIFHTTNQTLHYKRFGFFVSLSQVRDIVNQNESITDADGNVIYDLPIFLKSVSNLRYSILYHHGTHSEENYLTPRVQQAISMEPNDISKDLVDFRKSNKQSQISTERNNYSSLEILSPDEADFSNIKKEEQFFCDPSTELNFFSPLSQLNQPSFNALSEDERINDVLKYIFTNDENESSPSNSDHVSYHQLSKEFKSSSCVNLNNCISDNATKSTSVVNNYLKHSSDTRLMGEVTEFAKERRKVLNLRDDQKLMLMGAYITEPDYERFKKFPEVMMIDCTHGTDEEKRELCTATGKDRHNNVYPISRCAIPNARNMIFHWKFSTFYKVHLPQKFHDRVRLIITDGDQNECSQIDIAIRSGLFPNAVRSRCIWHIVDRGWQAHKPSAQIAEHDPSVTNYQDKRYGHLLSNVSRTMKNWCFSFGTSECESKLEYDISKELLRRFIHNQSTVLGERLVSKIEKFLEEHVFPHEKEMCFYPRSSLPIYDQSMNTPHEGYHNGVKASVIGPKEHHSLVRSSKQLITLSYLNASKFAKKNAMILHRTQLWSKSSVTNIVTQHVEGLIKKEIELIESYDLVRVNKDRWWSTYNGDRNLEPIENEIPKFRRIRVITLEEDGTLHCTCNLQNRFLFPCRHILKINKGKIVPEDVCVRNYAEYAQYYGDDRFPDKTRHFDDRLKQYNGPKYHIEESYNDLQNMCYPIYECKSLDDHNYDHFNNGDTNFVEILNYRLSDYEQFLPVSIRDTSQSLESQNISFVGLSDSHNTIDDSDAIETFPTHNGRFQSDSFSKFSPLLREMDSLIGSDESMYKYAEEKLKDLLLNLFRMNKEKLEENTNSTKRDVPSSRKEWVSCNLATALKKGNKRQRYHVATL